MLVKILRFDQQQYFRNLYFKPIYIAQQCASPLYRFRLLNIYNAEICELHAIRLGCDYKSPP